MTRPIRNLSVGVKLFALILMSTILIMLLILVDSPLMAEGQILAHLIRWQPYNKAYECMIFGVNVVMGWMLWRASADPLRHWLMISFGIWANLIHAAIMMTFAFVGAMESLHAVGDVLFLGVPALALLFLRSRIREPASEDNARTP